MQQENLVGCTSIRSIPSNYLYALVLVRMALHIYAHPHQLAEAPIAIIVSIITSEKRRIPRQGHNVFERFHPSMHLRTKQTSRIRYNDCVRTKFINRHKT